MKVTQKQCVSLLKRYSLKYSSASGFDNVLRHSTVVRQVAKEILKDISEFSTKNEEFSLRKDNKEVKKIDTDLVLAGAMLHDIGRFKCPPDSKDSIRHGVEGYNILMGEGLSDLAQIARNHIGFGIKKSDIIRLGLNLPKKDFIPTTTEEKIVCFADKLVNYDNIISFEDCLRRFTQEIGLHAINRGVLLENEIMALCGNKGISIKSSRDLIRFIPDKKIKEIWNASLAKRIFCDFKANTKEDNTREDNLNTKEDYANITNYTFLFVNIVNSSKESILCMLLKINELGELMDISYNNRDSNALKIEVFDEKILEIYKRSEEIWENPKVLIDFIDYMVIPEEIKQRIILALLNR
jgi:uncharacterized protein (TIGR00295 family)